MGVCMGNESLGPNRLDTRRGAMTIRKVTLFAGSVLCMSVAHRLMGQPPAGVWLLSALLVSLGTILAGGVWD
jgi:hypothetical protein